VKVNCDNAVANEGVLLVFEAVQFVTVTGSFPWGLLRILEHKLLHQLSCGKSKEVCI